jgi:protein-disulfide isomerase
MGRKVGPIKLEEKTKKRFWPVKLNFRSILAGIVLMIILTGVVMLAKRSKPVPLAPAPSLAGAYPSVPKTQGPATAPVKIVEYSDFECPSCRVAQQELHKIIQEYPGKIQLTFKHFPLTSHRWSIYAHQAAECMHIQGKFWPYQDKLYEKQSEWAPSAVPPVEIMRRSARELGADMGRFGKCMSDVSVTKAIYAEKEEGNQRQVNATPTLFLGEERFVGPREMQERGENAIRKALGLPPIPVPEQAPLSPVAVPPLSPVPVEGNSK